VLPRDYRYLLEVAEDAGRPAMTAEADVAGLVGGQRTGADACVHYLASRHQFLRYDQALAAGWPLLRPSEVTLG
jgi:hypothetical protein